MLTWALTFGISLHEAIMLYTLLKTIMTATYVRLSHTAMNSGSEYVD